MKRLTLSLLIVFLTSPLFTLAQGIAASRYCPDPAKDFFKGSIYHENGKPWIEVKVDPDFEKKMVAERNLTAPLPLTPVYDLVVQIKPVFNYYCISEWVEGEEVTAEKLPPFLHVTAAIVVGTKDEAVVDPVVFSRTNEQDEQGLFVYERKMKGWQSGIAPDKKMERLIAAVSQNAPVNVLLEIAKPNADVEEIKSSVRFGLCAPLWGNGRHGLVYTRGSGEGTFTDFSRRVEKVIQNGFRSIEPFKKYEDDFSHFLDLAQNNEIFVWVLKFFSREGDSEYKQSNLLSRFSEQSSCQGGTKLMYDAGSLGQGTFGVTAPFAHAAFISVSKFYEKEYPDKISVERTSVHEFSHAFAGLNDEAVYRSKPKNPRSFPPISKNCSTSPSSWSFNKKTYAQPFRGCSFDFLPGVRPGTDFFPLYRPSDDSIMNYRGSRMFNVVSCGYILEAIKGGDAKSYFPECAAMNGVIKDGVGKSASAWDGLSSLLSLFSNSSGSLAAGAAETSEAQTGEFVIIESFDPKDPWGEIIEVVPDSQTITPPTPTTQPPPAPPSDNLGVNAESIFDNISLDLKVNGKDGPVTITPGSRIVVSWISEGATRCRAVWSKNDIKLSGTAAGRLSRSVTIRAACINAEGERADDAVQVLIDTESS